MKSPFISVIVPSLNEEKYIENTLMAIKNQNHGGEYEIIVADGMSNDKTVRIAKKYTKNVIAAKKRGVAAGRNAGALHAKGDILVFIDADTIPSANLFSSLAKAFKNKDVVGVACKLLPIKSTNSIKNLYKFYNKFMKLTISLKKASIPGVCCAYRKSVFEKLNGFNENLSTFEDVDFSLRANKLGKIMLLSNCIALTSSRRVEKWGADNSFFSYLFTFLKFYLTGKGYSVRDYMPIR